MPVRVSKAPCQLNRSTEGTGPVRAIVRGANRSHMAKSQLTVS